MHLLSKFKIDKLNFTMYILANLTDQVYSNTLVPTQVKTSQHESTRVRHETTRIQHESTSINTSLTGVNTNQYESNKSQHESARVRHESIRPRNYHSLS